MLSYHTIVIGAGPIGLIAAMNLGQLGHKVALIDKNSQPYPYAKASMVDGHFLLVIYSLLDQASKEQIKFTPIEFGEGYLSRQGKTHVMTLKLPEINGYKAGQHHFGPMNFIEQSDIEAICRAY